MAGSFTAYPASSTGNVNDFDVQAANNLRKRKLAEMLQSDALSNTMQGYDNRAPVGMGYPLAKIAQALASVYANGQAEDADKKLAADRKTAFDDVVSKMPKDEPAGIMGAGPGDEMVATPEKHATPEAWMKWGAQLGDVNPFGQKLGSEIIGNISKRLIPDPSKAAGDWQVIEAPDKATGRMTRMWVNKANPSAGAVPIPGVGTSRTEFDDKNDAARQLAALRSRDPKTLTAADQQEMARLSTMTGDMQVTPPGGSNPNPAATSRTDSVYAGVQAQGAPNPRLAPPPNMVPNGALSVPPPGGPQQGGPQLAPPPMIPPTPGPGSMPQQPPQPPQDAGPPSGGAQGAPQPVPSPADRFGPNAPIPGVPPANGKPVVGNFTATQDQSIPDLLKIAQQDANAPGGAARDDRPQGRGTVVQGGSVMFEGAHAPKVEPFGYDNDGKLVHKGDNGLFYRMSADARGNQRYDKFEGDPVSLTPPAEFEKEVSKARDLNTALAHGHELVDMIEKNGTAFGIKALPNATPLVGGYYQQKMFNEKEREAQFAVQKNYGEVLHLLYGAAQSAGEKATGRTFIPDSNDPPNIIAGKLKAAIAWSETEKGKQAVAAYIAAESRGARKGGGASQSNKALFDEADAILRGGH